MSQPAATAVERSKRSSLPKRDWILFPLISLSTIVIIVMGVFWLSAAVFPPSTGGLYQCVMGTGSDQVYGLHGSPNTVCRGSNRDTPSVEYRMNSCGHRTSMACDAPKPAGVFRIVMVGSSVAIGEGVPVEKTLASLLPAELTRQTGRKIQLYNEGMFAEVPDAVAQYFDQVLPQQPDLVLWVVTPHDLTQTATPKSAKDPLQRDNYWRRLLNALAEWPANVALDSFLYSNVDRYLRTYLQTGADAGFLRTQYDPAWQYYLHQFAFDLLQVELKARTAGVPVVVAYIPNRAQAAMVSMNYASPGFDAYHIDREMRSAMEADGGMFVDTVPDFSKVPVVARYYFPVNGHPTEEGCALIAKMISRQLMASARLSLRTSESPYFAKGQ